MSLQSLIERLEHYPFACEAGDLKSCKDWQDLKATAAELLATCKLQHEALDMALAMLIEAKRDFYPSESPMWPAMVRGNEVIKKAEAQS